MNSTKFSFFVLIFSIISFSLNGQSIPKVDSLWQEVNKTLPDTEAHFNATVNLVALYDSLRLSNHPFKIHRKKDSLFIKANEVELVKAINWIKSKNEHVRLSRAQLFLLKHYHLIKQDAVAFISLANELIKRDTFYSLEDKFYTYDILSFFYNSTGFYKEFIDITPELFEVGRKINDDGSTKHNEFIHTAMAYYRLKEFNTARRYFKKALNDMPVGFTDWHKASLNNNIGLSFFKEENMDSAHFYYKKGLNLLETFDYSKTKVSQSQYFHFIDVINSNIEFLYIEKGNYDKAIIAIKKELKSGGPLNQFVTEIQAGNKLGRLYYYKKDYVNALKYLDIAEKTISSEYQNNLKIENWKWRSKALLAQGKQDESEFYYNLMTTMEDSIASAKALQENRIASVLYEVEKKDSEIKSQQVNIALLNSKSKIQQQLMVFGAITLFGIFGFVLMLRSRNNARKQQLIEQQFSHDLLNEREQERIRISKELHDSVGQQLTLIKKKAQSEGLNEMSNLTKNVLSEVRSISRDLYPSILNQLGLTRSIDLLLLEIDKQTDLFVSVELDIMDNFFGKEESLNIYRFIQESINNVIKHSNAKTLIVSVNKKIDKFEILIKDNGIGFNQDHAKTQNSLGLKTMKERIHILNGKIHIKSNINKGTTITVQLPI